MEYTHQAKIVIVGERQTGKSTLLEKLKNPDFDIKKHKTTTNTELNICKGVQITHPQIKGKSIHTNVFDFGDKELDYKTHQFFFTPSALYIMVIDSRTESPNLTYWLHAISQVGKESGTKAKLFFVINKKKDSHSNVDVHNILNYYKDFLDTRPPFIVDLEENDIQLKSLLDSIRKELVVLSPNKYQKHKLLQPIRRALARESKQPYITVKRLTEIFSQNNVKEEIEQYELSNCLHELGEIIHYQNDVQLMDLVILDSNWILKRVYDFLNDPSIKNRSVEITIDSFFQIFKKKGYSSIDAQKIWFLLSRNTYDICYRTKRGCLIIPTFLTDEKPVFLWEKQNGSLQFRYQFDLMPDSLMIRLLALLNTHYNEKGNLELFWKKGVLLSMPDLECKILIQQDDAESKENIPQIIIEVIGESFQRKFALRRIRDIFEQLHNDFFHTIPFIAMVPCNCSVCRDTLQPRQEKLENLLKFARIDINLSVPCYQSGEQIAVGLLLEGVYNGNEISSLVNENQNMEKKEKRGDVHQHIYAEGGNVNVTGQADKVVVKQSEVAPPSVKEVTLTPWKETHLGKSTIKGSVVFFIIAIVASVVFIYLDVPFAPALLFAFLIGMVSGLCYFLISYNNDKRYRFSRFAFGIFGIWLVVGQLLPNIKALFKVKGENFNGSIEYINDNNIGITVMAFMMSAFLCLLDYLENKNK